MSAYRRLPSVVDAIQWTGDNAAELDTFFDDDPDEYGAEPGKPIHIEGGNGDVIAHPGDWIVYEQPNYYVFSPGQFHAAFEAVQT